MDLLQGSVISVGNRRTLTAPAPAANVASIAMHWLFSVAADHLQGTSKPA